MRMSGRCADSRLVRGSLAEEAMRALKGRLVRLGPSPPGPCAVRSGGTVLTLRVLRGVLGICGGGSEHAIAPL